MPTYDDPPQWSYGTGGYTFTYPYYTADTSAVTITNPQPFVAVPVTPVPPPEDESPLAWLRAQVSEVCELARAA